MNKILRQINVFIASPGDVSDARDRVRKAIKRINRLVAKRSGFLLEPVGWEDIPASKAARTQNAINPYVDAAEIFIGILNKRFGRPTGVAESGTEEEYLRMEKRWHEEDPKPEVMIYFRKLPEEDLSDPGEQLKKVLKFKQDIADTDLYKEFKDDDDLCEMVENGLADWIHRQSEPSAIQLRHTDVDTLESIDIEILALLVYRAGESSTNVYSEMNYSQNIIEISLARLERHGLILLQHEMIRPSNSTEAFLVIVKNLLNQDKWKILLESEYYNNMLKRILSDLISIRFHCKIEKEMADLLQNLALLSPSVASYILFGDTTSYDNTAEQAQSLAEQQLITANEIMKSNILHQALLRYAEDSMNGNILGNLEGRMISGQLITVRVAAAYEDGLAFDAISTSPIMRVKALENLEKGHLVSGTPSFFVQAGMTFMHMGEFDLAMREFDKALGSEMPANIRAAAMNNKGLILLNRGQVSEARVLFQESARLAPELPEPQNNLKLAESMLVAKKEGNSETTN